MNGDALGQTIIHPACHLDRSVRIRIQLDAAVIEARQN
jgi:hypothetical protein